MPPRREPPEALPPIKELALPMDLLSRIDALPDKCIGVKGHPWTPDEDTALLKYWPVKRQSDIARALGLSENTCRDRYRLLLAETEERT
jgi:hypothetical protein